MSATGNGLVLLSLLFCCCLSTICAYEYPCTYTSSSGDYYDLSPLSFCDHSGYVVGTKDGSFNINICNTVTGCGGSSASCQDSNYNTGTASDVTWTDLPSNNGKGVVLTYKSGSSSGCDGNKARSSVFTFHCNASYPDAPLFVFASEQPQCVYNFQVYTKAACPVTKAPQVQICPTYVHLVPHTHDDVGWLQTIEGYYENQVKHILDTVVSSLIANPDRKFIYVEQAFFYLWWTDSKTTDQQRTNLKNLVKNGQFEFVIGGWVMQDEACTTYGADIDQMTQGHQFLLNAFGVTPTKGWQLDPFGASSVTPTLNKLSGFDAHLIDRLSNKASYENSQRLEFFWRGSPSLGDKAEIFTNIMDGGGAGYCDWLGNFNFGDDPVTSSNVADYGNKFLTMVNQRSGHVRTPHFLAAWGCDFAFQNATAMFNSMDKVVAWLKTQEATSHVFVRYSTVSEYFAAEMATPGVKWPVNEGSDFFAYYDSLWWTGYYTSRVQLKGLVRQGEATARAAEPIYVLSRVASKVDPSNYDQLNVLRTYNADSQHHDGVTGTSEPNVVDMYANNQIEGIGRALNVTAKLLGQLMQKSTLQAALSPSLSGITNIKNGQTQALVLYNSLGWARNDVVTIPISRNDVVVTNAASQTITTQFAPNYNTGAPKYLLTFSVPIPALGFTTVFITSPNNLRHDDESPVSPNADVTIENSILSVTVSSTSGLITKVSNKQSGVSLDFNQNVEWYKSQHSGAYAFGPNGNSRKLSMKPPVVTVTQGPYVDTIYQNFPCDDSSSSYAKQTIRIFHSPSGDKSNVENFIEFSYELGVLPSNHEIVATFNTSIHSANAFATDDNGFEFQQRVYEWTIPLEANYYPMVYAAYIRDPYAQLSLISERSHGASSLGSGRLEVMIHRNPDQSDGFGPGLTDTTVVYPSLRAIIDSPANSPQAIYRHTYLMNFPITFFSAPATPSNWVQNFATQASYLSGDLPPNVHLLALNALDNTSTKAIIRFTHLFAVGDDNKYSTPVTIDIAKYLSPLVKINSIVETTVTANKVISNKVNTTITLLPKDIRTFIIGF